jgi:putative glycosyltransferase (TIGR04348 family)
LSQFIPLRIALITPAGARLRTGNRHTALRWARLLKRLGHRVDLATRWRGRPADLLIALHAWRSRDSIARFHRRHPRRPLLVVLTGTDLYRDLAEKGQARRSVRLAHGLIVLQEEALASLPAPWRAKAQVIYQSAPKGSRLPGEAGFAVCVVGHLREEKDPFRTAYALAHLPPTSHIRVEHLGRALDPRHAEEARRLMGEEPRYRWRGEVPPRQVRETLRRSRLMVMSSRMEGGANVISEALAVGLPVLASRVPGNVGMLGRDYAGYFPVGDERALAALLARAEADADFLAHLSAQCRRRARGLTPARERADLARAIKAACRRAQKRQR